MYDSVTVLETPSDYIMWLKLSKKDFSLDDDIILGIIYQPPENSRFYTDNENEIFEVEITATCIRHKYVYLLGDMNARTSDVDDFIEADPFLSDYFDFDETVLNHFNKVSSLAQYNMSYKRASQDRIINKQGEHLLDICKSSNLFILNGRCGNDKDKGKLTFRNISLLDYGIASVDSLKFVKDFETIELDALFSDGHSLIQLTLNTKSTKPKSNIKNIKNNTKHWDQEKAEQFKMNLDPESIETIVLKLIELENSPTTLSQSDLNSVLEQISAVFTNAAKVSFGQYQTQYRSQNDKVWFGEECRKSRSEYMKARTRHKKCPSELNKNLVQEKSKTYKNTMNKYINKHIENTKCTLRKLNRSKPKEFWKIVNNLESSSIESNLNETEFYEYFREINSTAQGNSDSEEVHININDDTEILNSRISAEEITKCIKNLKNNKSFAHDKILNEYLKTTLNQMLPVYVRLFNVIFDTGFIPDTWLEGIIRPIHKTGDLHNPENYRPITILSCFGKLFTAVLNARLNRFVEDYEILEENQAGFRKGYATSDHIFVLHSLIEILKTRKKKLFCTFVDFSKAFDSVWRMGLWQKLLKNNIDGKFLRIIYNMYKSIKSCIRLNGQETSFFRVT